MTLLAQILDTLPDGKVHSINVGLHWTCVQMEIAGRIQAGLASTLEGAHDHGTADIPEAGELRRLGGLELARKALTASGPMASITVAALNALLPRLPDRWVQINAEEVIAQRGADKLVALVGRFPFTDRLRDRVGQLEVLERRPKEGEHPAEAAPQIIPQAEVVAITSMTITNGSLEGLLALCRPEALVIMLGPTTPLTPILFDYGVDILAGSIVEKPEPVIHALQEGGNFRQLHRAGVRLVTMQREDDA